MVGARVALAERWLLRAGVFLVPLAYVWNTYDTFVLPKLLVARVLVIGLLILVVVRAAISGRLAIRRTPLDLPLLAFVGSAALSTVFAVNRNVAVFGTYSRYDGLLTTVIYVALFWLTVQVVSNEGEARGLLWVLLASGYVAAAVAIVQSVADSVASGPLVPAFGSLGQKNVLGIFLAMLLPLAIHELVEADSWNRRVLALNVSGVIGVALALSLSRSAWVGAALGCAVLLGGRRSHPPPSRGRGVFAIAGIGVVLAAALVLTGLSLTREKSGPVHLGPVAIDLSAWGGRPGRPYVWRDSLALIASRPLLGYGPDTFGLVYPRFQSTDLGPQPWDKTHAESLQVAATQGLVGLCACALLLWGIARAFWRARRTPAAVAIFAGVVAYQVTLQVNFTALAAALPFWIFLALAMESWGAVAGTTITLGHRGWIRLAAVPVVAALAALAVVATVPPYLADSRLLYAVTADAEQRGDAATAAAEARRLAPQESVYAVEAGNIAFERGRWAEAAAAYREAARLGTYNALVYRNLALADRYLGREVEALAAARQAVEQDRFDPANRALLAELEAPSP